MKVEEREEIYENCTPLPIKYYIDEYETMEFIEITEDVKTYNQLQIAINDKGAFRRFKDTHINFYIIDDWYKFIDDKYKEIAIKWYNKNNIEIE